MKILLLILLFPVILLPQNYKAELKNGYQTSDREFEFDVLISSTVAFELTAYQVALKFNQKIGTDLSFHYVTGSSSLKNKPTNIGIYDDWINTVNIRKLAFGSGPGSDTIIGQQCVGRFLIRSQTPFRFELPQISWACSDANTIRTIFTGTNFVNITNWLFHYDLEYDIPLPVTLIYFTTRLRGDSLIAEWETASEINTYGFKLMRALAQDSEFIQVGFVPASGNSNSNKYYRYVDSLSLAGTYKYYLRIIDIGGREEKTQTEFVTYKGNDIQQPISKNFIFIIIGICVFIALAIFILLRKYTKVESR